MKLLAILCIVTGICCVDQNALKLALDYHLYKDSKYVCYMTCYRNHNNHVNKTFLKNNIRISVKYVDEVDNVDIKRFLHHSNSAVGIILDASCNNTNNILHKASQYKLFDQMYYWLVINTNSHNNNDTVDYVNELFGELNISVDADVIIATDHGMNHKMKYMVRQTNGIKGYQYYLFDIFNFGKIQGNEVEVSVFGTWRPDSGLDVKLKGYKYYNRWDFQKLPFRTISVVLNHNKQFKPEMLTENKHTVGVAAMTKITSQLLYILKEQHNFRFNYTIVGQWIGSVDRNATSTITKALYWREQDLASTAVRMIPKWLDWFDSVFPPATDLQTKFYYLISASGVGAYENRFLTPMSSGVWYCALATGVICFIVLGAAALMERRPQPGPFAFFSVVAIMFQQDYEDGIQISEQTISGQGRRLTLLVIGLTSMLLYNYYTSSVVSWLLNAAPPSITSLEELMNSDLEVVFEDIGYSRGWLEIPGKFYLSGIKNPAEDQLRDKKVTSAKRTAPVLMKVETGIELVRSGGYAFHTEPYSASQVIAKTFDDEELCNLGELQMMQRAPVYMMVQKRSPYKEFFTWSMMRLLERGHVKASRARFAGTMPACSGQRPRALALGQAAPAFLLLTEIAFLCLLILALEVLWQKVQLKKALSVSGPRKKRSERRLAVITADNGHLYRRM